MELCFNKYKALKDSICPQVFSILNDKLYFFDKINRHEGRIYVIDKENNKKIITETDDNIIIMSNEGCIFSIKFEQFTKARELDDGGSIIKEFFIDGIFFDVYRDDGGNYIFLGLKEKKMCITIFNKQGLVISSVYISNLIIGCGICGDKEHLLIGAVDVDDRLKLYEYNYLGVKINEWEIYNSCKGRVIEKIINYRDFEILLINDKYNKIVVLNKLSGEIHEIFPDELKLKEITDLIISDDKIYILSGKEICYEFAERLVLYSSSWKKINLNIDASVFLYKYAMYSLEIYKNFISLIKKVSSWGIISLILYLAAKFSRTRLAIEKIPFIVLFYFVTFFTAAVVVSKFALAKKHERINILLSINNNINIHWLPSQILIGCIFFCTTTFLQELHFINILIYLITAILLSISFGFLAINRIRENSREYVVELLEDGGEEINQYVRKVISKMSEKKSDKLLISVLTNTRPSYNLLSDWINSRKYIINKEIIVKTDSERITAILDLSERDIKYSRASILMDYICFIKSKMDIKEIKIHNFSENMNIIKKT